MEIIKSEGWKRHQVAKAILIAANESRRPLKDQRSAGTRKMCPHSLDVPSQSYRRMRSLRINTRGLFYFSECDDAVARKDGGGGGAVFFNFFLILYDFACDL